MEAALTRCRLLPLTIEKNATGNIAFALSLWRLFMRRSIDGTIATRFLSTLAPSTILGIDFSLPLKGMLEETRPRHHAPYPSRPESNCTGRDLVMFGTCLSTFSLSAEDHAFHVKIIEECNKNTKTHCGKQILSLLKVETLRHYAWVGDMVQIYVLRVVGLEPERPEHWMPPRRLGCGQCEECRRLDKFLLDQKQTKCSLRAKQSIRTHLELRFASSHRQFRLATDPRGTPHALVVEKRHHDYDEQLLAWQQRKESAKKELQSLFSEQHMRAFLKSRYDDLINARIVTRQLSETTGAPQSGTQAICSWEYDRVTRPAQRTVAGATTTSYGPRPQMSKQPMSTNMASSGAQKRTAPVDGIENQRPSKRKIEVIDLCDD